MSIGPIIDSLRFSSFLSLPFIMLAAVGLPAARLLERGCGA
jgi:hypothetical protein